MNIMLRSTYMYVFTATVIFAVYGWCVFSYLGVDYFTGAEELVRIGRAISVLIVGGYAFEYLILFVVGIFSIKIQKHALIIDDRDKEIARKSIVNAHSVLSLGLLFSIGALALGVSAFWVFHSMVLAYMLSVVAELATKLFLYKG